MRGDGALGGLALVQKKRPRIDPDIQHPGASRPIEKVVLRAAAMVAKNSRNKTHSGNTPGGHGAAGSRVVEVKKVTTPTAPLSIKYDNERTHVVRYNHGTVALRPRQKDSISEGTVKGGGNGCGFVRKQTGKACRVGEPLGAGNEFLLAADGIAVYELGRQLETARWQHWRLRLTKLTFEDEISQPLEHRDKQRGGGGALDC